MRPYPDFIKISKFALLILFSSFFTACNYLDLLPLHPEPQTHKNKWIRKNDFTDVKAVEVDAYAEISTSFTIGAKAYVIKADSIYEYDPLQDHFMFKTQIADFQNEGAVTFDIHGNGYLLSGYGGNLWQYNPEENILTQKASFAGMPRQSAFGFGIHNKGYYGGGGSLTITMDDFWEYDPQTDKWTQKSDLPDGTRRYAKGVSIQNRGFLMLGVTGERTVNNAGDIFMNTIWEYLPQSDSWGKRSDFPGKGRKRPAAFSIADRGYIGLGETNAGLFYGPIENDSSFLKDFWSYHPGEDRWEKVADFPGSRRYRPVGFSVSKKGYAGFGSGDKPLYDLWQYNP